MLADDPSGAATGAFDTDMHLPGTFLREMMQFVLSCLPLWRDDPLRRKNVSREPTLTSQLCKFLNNHTRRAKLDHINFQPEDPDTAKGGRTIDLIASPKGCSIWINGRQHTYYDPLIPIECKRLPTPDLKKRERREYLHTRRSTTGGVQRFMAGLHGGNYETAAIIGYVQSRTSDAWMETLNHWVKAFVACTVKPWTTADSIAIEHHDAVARTILGRSSHNSVVRPPFELWHLLVEM